MRNLIDLSSFKLGGNLVEVTPNTLVGSELFWKNYFLVFIEIDREKYYLDGCYSDNAPAKNQIKKWLRNTKSKQSKPNTTV